MTPAPKRRCHTIRTRKIVKSLQHLTDLNNLFEELASLISSQAELEHPNSQSHFS